MASIATATVIFFFLVFAMPFACKAQVWHLNHSYAYNSEEAKQNTLMPQKYPGTLLLPFLTTHFSDVSISLCFLSSPSPSSNSSSFTLSLYMYASGTKLQGAIIWTANRETPIKGPSMSLTLHSDGNLVLLGEDPNTPVWSSNTSHQGVAAMELTLNPASLTLYTRNGSVIWQSADYPTDTLTMYQYLLANKKLVSWASPSDPSLGSYSLVMEPGGLALYANMLNYSQPYWIWGFFGLNDTFSVKHTCKLVSAFMDPEGALFMDTYDIGIEADNSSYWAAFCNLQPISAILTFSEYGMGDSVILYNKTFLRLDYDGNLRVYSLGSVWSIQLDMFGSDPCSLPNSCGPYGICSSGSQCNCPSTGFSTHPSNLSRTSFGCSPSISLTCHTSDSTQAQTAMLPLHGLDYFSNEFAVPAKISTNESCAAVCLHDCSCLAAFWHVHTKACFYLQDFIGSFHSVSNQSDYITFVKIGISKQQTGKKPRSVLEIFLLCILFGSVSFLVFMFLTILIWYKKECYKAETEDEYGKDTFFDDILKLPTRFSYDELIKITDGFEKKLGKGGSGSVYAGVLSNGTKVAVKKLEGIMQGEKEFRAELAIMAGIHHNNLLSLIGFCADEGRRLLVYEDMENGSLDQWLFDKTDKRTKLTWEIRCKIALGTAQGLAYLHEGCREKIIHLDIKPENILLDANFDAKVADFGMSRLVGRNESGVMTTMRGTPGYLAPDWIKKGTIDEKCDVFSFGMLLMEIISGRRNLDCSVQCTEQIYYPEWAFWEAQKLDVRKLSDATVETEEEVIQLRSIINTAFLCVVEDSAIRPSMSRVVQMLQGELLVDKLVLSKLHQGLLFVLRNPSSYSKICIEEAVQSIIEDFPKSSPL